MTHFADSLGWFLFLLVVMLFVAISVTNLVKLVWAESSEGNVVDGTDALMDIVNTCVSGFQHMMANRWASVSAVAVFFLTSTTSSVSVYACLGYASMAYAVSGLLTPFLIRRMNPLSPVSTAQASSPVQSSDS